MVARSMMGMVCAVYYIQRSIATVVLVRTAHEQYRGDSTGIEVALQQTTR